MKKKKQTKKTAKKPANKAAKKAAPNAAVHGDRELREQVVYLLKGGGAHVHFSDGLDDFPSAKYGTFAAGLPHTAWQLLEHARLAQWDILEFSRNPKHVSPPFPSGYWPKTPGPPDGAAWSKSVKVFQRDLQAMVALISNIRVDLHAPLPWGGDQTLLREALVLADHNAKV